MSWTARELIIKRRALWIEGNDLTKDRQFVSDVAQWLVSEKGAAVRNELIERPELFVELIFLIVNKSRQTVPFFLNDVQKEFCEVLNKAIKEFSLGRRLHLNFIVLKGRQQGFTSLITAYQLAKSVTKMNFAGFTLADNAENTEAIFSDKAKFPYEHMPKVLRPTEKYNNRRELHFSKLNSRWRVATAGTNDVGRSRTLGFFHGSEVAFWPTIHGVMVGLGPALTQDSIKILESTANGFNEFKQLWDAGTWTNLFFEWWRTAEYRLKYESSSVGREFESRVASRKDWIYERCRWLHDQMKLSWPQVYWYYVQHRNLKEMIKQEYPCSPEEAFLSSGRCIFEQEQIIHRTKHLAALYRVNPPKRGEFRITWDNPETKGRIEGFNWVDDPHGLITIYEPPITGHPYVGGGDTKGEGSDNFAGQFIHNPTGRRVATLWGNPDSDEYTHQMYCLGMHYNEALLAIESNFNTYPLEELNRLRYPRQYQRKQYDSFSGKYQDKYGFKTDGNTRPLIIDREIVLIRDHIDLFTDLNFFKECLTFIKNDKGRPEAESGCRDDLIFADMIAEEARGQQNRLVTTNSFSVDHLSPDLQDDYDNASDEEKRYLLKKWGLLQE